MRIASTVLGAGIMLVSFKILKELKTFAKNYAIAIIPLIVLAVTFALIKCKN